MDKREARQHAKLFIGEVVRVNREYGVRTPRWKRRRAVRKLVRQAKPYITKAR